ncbi:iron-siderophore ABC transporter substrate-binding protein [Haematomicrobium sanguinis]|uniref:iron-siderophore ABC transporter substrate-binding protein n=1 Tax=Haematomicrobium sanguinis TaxID=479106 RepID=UPI00054EBE0B|nr:iron-siderophore ABC transporter substrate-binding protein [Haematomicrobium sanguinis]
MKKSGFPSRVFVLIAALLSVALLASGCAPSASTNGELPSSGAPADSSAFPVTLDSALGQVTIEKKPERVVTIGWGSQDVALALGVVPVGMQDMSGNTGDGTGILPWDKELIGSAEPSLIKSSSSDIPFESILALKPDVILAVNSGLDPEQYKRLSEIAPTVAYPGKPWLTSWQDQTTIVGKALGMSAEAEDLVTKTTDLIASAKKANPGFADKTIAFGSGTAADSFNIYQAGDSRVQLLKELGFQIAPSVPTEGDKFAVQMSLENLTSIDSDVLVSWFLDSGVQQSLESSPLFADIPAVKNGGYIPLTDPPMVFATSSITVLSLPWMLDKYLPLLKAAAAGEAPKL